MKALGQALERHFNLGIWSRLRAKYSFGRVSRITNLMLRRIGNAMESAIEATASLSNAERFAMAGGCLILLGFIDAIAGFPLGFEHLFYIPIWFAAWFFNRLGVLAVTAICTAWISATPAMKGYPYTPSTTLSVAIMALVFTFGGIALGHIREVFLRERLRARIDFLTGCLNTMGFYELVGQMLDSHREDSRPFAILYVDLDRFKQLNDTFGHLEADRVLKHLGQTLLSETRRGDVVCRLGGDEFVVLLDRIAPQTAFAAAERIRSKVDRELARKGWPVTASMGCVAFGEPTQSVHAALQIADETMYLAKGAGRSQIATRVWRSDESHSSDSPRNEYEELAC